MNRSLAVIVAGFALSLTACTANAQSNRGTTVPQTERVDLTKACPGTRWIAVLRSPNRDCPISRGYPEPCRVTDLECRMRTGISPATARYQRAQDPDEEKLRGDALRDAGLDRLCIYDAQGSGATGMPRLPQADVLRIDRDCSSAASLGSDLQTMMWSPLQTQFLQQTGRAAFTPAPKARKVRLAIVDSQPTSEELPTRQGCSPHGYTLAHMAQNLVCSRPGASSEGCAAKVTTRLALLQPGEGRSPQSGEGCEGGVVGWIGDLAPAIVDEIDAWRTAKGNDRLILNLSVGWDPQLFGGLKETSVGAMAAPVQAVYRALVYAAKRGALVVAAAGNSVPGPTPHEGPILPAAWEGWVPGSGFKGKANPRPLIYAVGGVRWNDYPLPNSRPKAMPPRVAYADHGVVRDPSKKDGPTAILTGTSVSALVVSSAAALAWAEKPTLSPAELMQTLENTWGYATASTAQFGTHAGAKAKRICLGGKASCTGAKANFSYSPALDSFTAPTFDASGLTSSLPPEGAPCPSGKKFLKLPGAPAPASLCPCDQFQSANLKPWVDPQPGADGCDACTVRGPGPNGGSFSTLFPPLAGAPRIEPGPKNGRVTLYIDIPVSWLEGTPSLEATTLEVTYVNGVQPLPTVVSYSINQTFSKDGQTSLRVENLEPPALANPVIRSATLNFVILRDGEKMSLSSPLFFSP